MTSTDRKSANAILSGNFAATAGRMDERAADPAAACVWRAAMAARAAGGCGGCSAGASRGGDTGERRRRRDHRGVGRQRRRRRPTGPQGRRRLSGRRGLRRRTSPAARCSSPRRPARTSCRARSWRSTSRSAVRPTATWASPPSTRDPAGQPGQPQHHLQRGRQAGDLLDAGHRRAGGPRRRSTRRGTSSAAPRDALGVPAEDEVYRGDVVVAEVHRRRAVLEPQDQGLHHRAARPGRSAGGPRGARGRRRRRSTPRAGPRAGRWVRWAPRRASSTRSAPTASGRTSPAARSSTAPATGRQRRDRPGARQVRERRRAGGRPRLPDQQRGRRRPGARQPGQHASPPRTSRSSSGRPTTAR